MRRAVGFVPLLLSLALVSPELAQAEGLTGRWASNPAVGAHAAALQRPVTTEAVSCSTPLRLYNGTYLSGTRVSVYTRGVWINLSTFGFDNMTSSYRVGACAIELATGTNGSGSHYWRCLSPGCVENVMASGWNNVVSSVYLH